jgi:hypothetical protein
MVRLGCGSVIPCTMSSFSVHLTGLDTGLGGDCPGQLSFVELACKVARGGGRGGCCPFGSHNTMLSINADLGRPLEKISNLCTAQSHALPIPPPDSMQCQAGLAKTRATYGRSDVN